MAFVTRLESESKVYHVVTKGMGGQLMFENDDDRRFFLKRMEEYGDEERITFYAWCLMSNHVHMVIKSEIGDLSQFMRRLGTSYVTVFNDRHQRKGALLQRSFWSDPVLTDERLLATVRYVHQNPLKPGLCSTCAGYQWSSYREYEYKPGIVDTEFVLSILGGIARFERFHESFDDPKGFLDIDRKRSRLTLDEAIEKAHAALGESSISNLRLLPKNERDEKLCILKSLGLSIRQIEMLTGVGRNTIFRAER